MLVCASASWLQSKLYISLYFVDHLFTFHIPMHINVCIYNYICISICVYRITQQHFAPESSSQGYPQNIFSTNDMKGTRGNVQESSCAMMWKDIGFPAFPLKTNPMIFNFVRTHTGFRIEIRVEVSQRSSIQYLGFSRETHGSAGSSQLPNSEAMVHHSNGSPFQWLFIIIIIKIIIFPLWIAIWAVFSSLLIFEVHLVTSSHFW